MGLTVTPLAAMASNSIFGGCQLLSCEGGAGFSGRNLSTLAAVPLAELTLKDRLKT